MKRFASVRYDTVLAPSERETVTRTLRSAGAEVSSWTSAAGRTYASMSFEAEAALASAAQSAARVDAPSLVVLRITPDAPRRRSALLDALGGPGRFAGIIDARADDQAVIVELDARKTPLALVVAAIDLELRTAPGRTIEPLVVLEDATLAAFASALLCEPKLDDARLIEPFVDALCETSAPGAR